MARDGVDTVGARQGGPVKGSRRRDRLRRALPPWVVLLLLLATPVALIFAGPWLFVTVLMAVIGDGTPEYPPAPMDRLTQLPEPDGASLIGQTAEVVDSNDGMYPSSGAVAVRTVHLDGQFMPAVEATRAAARAADHGWKEATGAISIGHCYLDEIDGDALVLVIVPGDGNPALGEPVQVITAVARWSDAADDDPRGLCEGTAMAAGYE